MWITQASISDNGDIDPGRTFDVTEGLKELAAKYKDAAIKEIDVTVP